MSKQAHQEGKEASVPLHPSLHPGPSAVAKKAARRRLVMPPEPTRSGSVWGEEAVAWAREVRRRARRLGVGLGRHAIYDLRRVRTGYRPLAYRLWRSIEGYLDRVTKDREVAADLAAKPMRIALTPGRGPQLRQRGREL